jgi:hypothetical protein
MDISKKISTGLDTSCVQYGHMKKQFKQFMTTIKDRIAANPGQYMGIAIQNSENTDSDMKNYKRRDTDRSSVLE